VKYISEELVLKTSKRSTDSCWIDMSHWIKGYLTFVIFV